MAISEQRILLYDIIDGWSAIDFFILNIRKKCSKSWSNDDEDERTHFKWSSPFMKIRNRWKPTPTPQQCRPLLTKKCVIVLGFRYSAQTNYEMTIHEFLYSFLFFRAISIRKMQFFLSTDTVGIRFHFMKNGSFSFFPQIDEIMKRSHRMYQLKCSWLQISGIEHQLFYYREISKRYQQKSSVQKYKKITRPNVNKLRKNTTNSQTQNRLLVL